MSAKTESGVSLTIILSALGAALGGLLFGFDTAVISGTTIELQKYFSLSEAKLGFSVASALIGTVIGALISGKPADLFGRKAMMLLVGAIYVISSLGTALAHDWSVFIVFRFLGGLAIGAASVITPIYIAEVSPARFRGRLVAINQLNIVIGILVAFVSNYIIANLVVPDLAWRWMFGVVAIPSIVYFIITLILPESPRWILIRGSHSGSYRAEQIMQRLGFSDIKRQIEDILEEQKRSLQSAKARFFIRQNSLPIATAIVIAAFNQLSGINALLYYAPRIFESAGATSSSSLVQSIAVGLINLIFTIIALFLIDKIGRKKLIYAGSVICSISLFVVGFGFQGSDNGALILIAMLCFIVGHAIGQGAVIWVLISEIFPSSIRGAGQALGASTHWIAAAIITWVFPVVASSLGGWVFIFFAIMMALQLIWAIKFMPETNGIPLEDLSKDLIQKA
ncbi:MAG: sugar porter family MFS transporter [Helicobacter sp.]|nr:sugar porter family MFS transporter [Helicobacter sp.]